MPTKEEREGMRKRKAQLVEETATEEKKHIKGRWVSDSGAMQNLTVRRGEKLSRSVPKRMAKMNMMQIEEANTGLETEGGEVTDRVTQRDILQSVDQQTMRKKYDLKLDKLGPYTIDFSVNGTHVLLGGMRGHLANLKWQNFSLEGETQLKDRITDVKFLIDHSMVAVAQKRYVYMYSKEGVEMHIMSKMQNMNRLAYLQKHMLLCAASSLYSTMQYIDVSTGKEIGTKPPSIMRDPTVCMAPNPQNGVVTSCDIRGICKFWSPTVADPLVQIKAHSGGAHDIAFTRNGRYFVTLGGDHKMKIWDTRTLRTLEEYAITYTFNTIDISDNDVLAMGGGTNVQLWKGLFSQSKQHAPYMKHYLGYGNIAQTVKFCPFEDVLGIGHSNGFSSVIIPGTGEANPDIYYANPYETDAHRQERVVTGLLDKLPADTISMDIKVNDVNEKALEEYAKNLQANRKARAIREKKQRRVTKTAGDDAPTGLLVGNDEEVDEELGFKEKGRTREWKNKKEMQKERKMKKWDQKDAKDKVRSKQVMRHSRLVQRRRHQNSLKAKEDREGDGEGASGAAADGASGEADGGDLPTKRTRKERRAESGAANAAFRRFM